MQGEEKREKNAYVKVEKTKNVYDLWKRADKNAMLKWHFTICRV